MADLITGLLERAPEHGHPATPHTTPRARWAAMGPNSVEDIPYPSVDELNTIAGGGCSDKLLAADVLFTDKENALRVWPLVPSPEAWKTKNGYRYGARNYLCVVGSADGRWMTKDVYS